MRYCLKRDEDAHWYLVPVNQEDDFEAWIEAIENEWDDYDMPNGIEKIDGPHRLTFENPVEE